MIRKILIRVALVTLMMLADRALVGIAIEGNVAGAFLSPGGSVDLAAFVIAGFFLLNRVALSVFACAMLGWTAVELVRRLLHGPPDMMASRPTPSEDLNAPLRLLDSRNPAPLRDRD